MSARPRTLIFGHRGSPREATENTLASLALAVRQGADGVELDVQRALDGVPVVIHDTVLKRVFGLKGSVPRLAWPALERLTGARLPSFEQAAAWAASSGAWLNVEIKAVGVEEGIARTIEAMRLTERVILSSFDPMIVRRVGEVAPHMQLFYLTEHWNAAAVERLALSGAQGVCLHDDVATDSTVAALHEKGLGVIAWTVNDPSRVRELLTARIVGIITDYPAMAARERAALGL